jgi:hypothetical protein
MKSIELACCLLAYSILFYYKIKISKVPLVGYPKWLEIIVKGYWYHKQSHPSNPKIQYSTYALQHPVWNSSLTLRACFFLLHSSKWTISIITKTIKLSRNWVIYCYLLFWIPLYQYNLNMTQTYQSYFILPMGNHPARINNAGHTLVRFPP